MLLLLDFRLGKSVHQLGGGIALERRGLLLPAHCDDSLTRMQTWDRNTDTKKKKAESKRMAARGRKVAGTGNPLGRWRGVFFTKLPQKKDDAMCS